MITSITLPQPHYLFRNRHRGGAILLFVLIMLLVVSIIGVAAARSTLMQERMASNTNVRNIVFEAAESALAAGEIRVANTPEIWKTIPQDKAGDCHDGVCDRNTTTSPIWVTGLAWSDPKRHRKVPTIESGAIKVEPKYVIEDLGQTMASCDPNHIDITQSADCPYTSAQRYFRVVSFAQAYETQVMLQSTYLDPNPTRDEVVAAVEWKAKPPECGGKPFNPPGEKCCAPDVMNSKEWVSSTGTCPDYCEVTPGDHKEYDTDREECCNPGPTGERQLVDKTTGTCPQFCGNDLIDKSKEVCCDVQGTWSVYPGANKDVDCPQFCGNDPRGAGQVCCWKGNEQYSYTAASENDCPKFCEVGGTQIALNPGQDCCPDITGTKNEVITGACPDYCDGKVVGSGQYCCSIPRVAGGGKRLVNGGQANCPNFCGPNEIFPGQKCCGHSTNANAKIYDKRNNQQCCLGSNNATAIIGTNEYCCTDSNGLPVANSVKDCPIWCGYGNNAIRLYEGEECCTTWGTPVKAGKTEQCCPGGAIPKTASGRCPETCNGQSYDPGDQQCCYDYDANGNRKQHSPAASNSVCPQYCNAPGSSGHNKPLAPGQICCTVKDADNYGDIGQCQGGSGSGSGT